jgi:hypothetical protein
MQRDKKILFVHIPKCAGVSLAEALEKKIPIIRHGPHFKCKDLFDADGRLARDEFFVFTFVRNPWERLVSTFFYIMKGGRAEIDARRRDLILSKYQGDFRRFVQDIESWINIREADSIYPDQFIPHFRPQSEFILDNDGFNMIDFIGRVENIEQDFKLLCAALSVDAVKLPKSNRSSHGRYQKYYDDKSKDIVAEYYAKDIELFRYQFEKPNFLFRDLLTAWRG